MHNFSPVCTFCCPLFSKVQDYFTALHLLLSSIIEFGRKWPWSKAIKDKIVCVLRGFVVGALSKHLF